jgi:hypothetical protein
MRRQFTTLIGVLTVLSFPVTGATAYGADFFGCKSKICETCDNVQVIKLPPQQIAVSAVQPKVVVRNSRFQAAPVVQAAPMVATIYTPLALPLTTVGEQRLEERSSLLTAIHESDHQLLAITKAQAAQKAEMDATNRALQRHLDSLREMSTTATSSTTKDGIDAKQLKIELDNINKRLADIEKLLSIHDDVLQNAIKDGKINKLPPK